MKQKWTIILLFIISYGIIGCISDTPSSDKERVVTSKPLQSGLWLPEVMNDTFPVVYVVDSQEVMAIKDPRHIFKYRTKPTSDGAWNVLSLGTTFFMKEQPLQLQTVRSMDTVTYTRAELKTKFHWPVSTLEDLDTLLQETSNWKEENSDRTVVFYEPVCPQKLEKKEEHFYKMALLFETLPDSEDDLPSMYRQQLLFNYTGDFLYFFLENKATSKFERYVVISMTQEQWTLRSLEPPYSMVLWNRIKEPSMHLQKLLVTHNKRLAKWRKPNLENCD